MKHIFWAITILIAAISLQPRVVMAACSSPAGTAGDITYNSTHKTFQYCNDTNWVAMNTKTGSGTGGCTNPAGDEGAMVYNEDYRVLQGCAGNVWRAFGSTNPSSSKWRMITGSGTLCGVKEDNSAWCYGDDGGGQLGNDLLMESKDEFVRVAGGRVWKSISNAISWSNPTTCGIKLDDTLWCWGTDDKGQVGNGAASDNQPLPVKIDNNTWKMVSTSHQNACAIRSDDTLWCWGDDTYGQMGNGATSTQQDSPVQIGVGSTWKYVEINYFHACGIKTDNTAWCWGDNTYGQLGNGSTGGTQESPVAVSGGHSWKTLALSYAGTSCGIRMDNTAWCWGSDGYGRLGDGGGEVDSNIPVQVTGGGTWISISTGESGDSYFCGIKSDNTYWCWSYYDYGTVTAPVQVHADTDWQSALPPCGLKTNGSLWCRGGGAKLGYEGYLYQQNVPTITSVPGPWKSLWPNFCVSANDDSVWCWGYDLSGARGDGAGWSEPETIDELAGSAQWKQITRGCGIKSDDTGWCWGSNMYGELGNGGVLWSEEPAPVAISGGGTWKKLARTYTTSCGIKSDNSLWCWGNDGNGQVGNGAPTNDYTTPQAISGGGSWKDIDVGGNHSCGIKSDDSLWCWGSDSTSQIGNGAPTSNQNAPVAVSGGGTWKSIQTGSDSTCGLKTDSTLWCWGSDGAGQQGNGAPSSDITVPTQVGSDTWKSVSMTGALVCGIKSDNTGWCWGTNWLGQTGTNLPGAAVDTPTLLPGGNTWDELKVMSWDDSACGLSKGFLYCWGFNDSGQTLVQTHTNEMIAARCTNPARKGGEISYNSTENILQYCNGTDWVAMGKVDVPDEPPPPPPKKIFVTSTSYNGNLGGQTGGDALCAARATAAGLSGTYVVWLSQSGGNDAAWHTSGYTYHYIRTDGTKIADNFSDLVDGSLDAPINRDEFGNSRLVDVWTGTDEFGSFSDGGGSGNCTDFSSNSGAEDALTGNSAFTSADWSNGGLPLSCNSTLALYCIEQ